MPCINALHCETQSVHVGIPKWNLGTRKNTFNVDADKGLTGNPDGIISKSDNQLYITSPVVVLVEAKKSDLGSGLPQCIAKMEAARIFNDKKGKPISPVFGVVTDGVLWQFLSLQDGTATIDSYFYNFDDGSKIVGILKFFVESSIPQT